ncbi:MAG: acyltransferase [Alphaproteobacteria bacterium]|nr:acyltransferase [Alphaproteobacteria bacterium]MBL7099791.1 acyltransferase [Alphaproteobacteria bacterium]
MDRRKVGLDTMVASVQYLLRRLAGRPTCVKQPTTRLLSTARILNAGGPSSRISIGAFTIVRGELFVFAHGGDIRIGDWGYIGEGSRIWSGGRITIGNRVLIAHNVNVFDNLTHPISPEARHQQCKSIYERGHPIDISLGEKPVQIDDDSWIGANSTVLCGVHIGRAAIIGAGSVVTSNVPPYSIVAGNPAKVVRMISADELEPSDRAAMIEYLSKVQA